MNAFRNLALVWLLLILGACATSPQLSPGANSALLQDAQQALSDQDYTRAAQLLDQQNFDLLSTEQKQQHLLAQAETGIGLRQPRRTLDALNGPKARWLDNLSHNQMLQVSEWRAQAFELNQDWQAAIDERLFVAPLLGGQQAQANTDQIWLNLQSFDRPGINRLLAESPNADWQVWLALRSLSLESRSSQQLQTLLAGWRQRYSPHPLTLNPPTDLLAYIGWQNEPPSTIGLLLPTSGPLEHAGRAILAGFMAAHYDYLQQGGKAIQILVQDSNHQTITQPAQRLINDGAQLIIGPLDRTRVQALQQAQLSTPILALNQLQQPFNNANFYQFSLAPEHEISAITAHLSQQGLRTGGSIIQGGETAERSYQALLQGLSPEQRLVARASLANSNSAWLEQIKDLLDIDSSEQRIRTLQANLGTPMEAKPRLRNDLQFLTLFVQPEASVLIKPLLNLQFAENIPTYGTSSLLQINELRDLNGMYIAVTPWQLNNPPLRQALLDQHGHLGRLDTFYAMGVDAFQLQTKLAYNPDPSLFQHQGQTGLLRLSPEGVIKRHLSLARIRNGQLVPVELTLDDR